MSVFSGGRVLPDGTPREPINMRAHRTMKRLEAEERNAATPPERRRAYRRSAEVRLLTDIFAKESA